MKLKIATWNMGHWAHKKNSQRAWDFLINEISPDIALVQESSPQDIIDNNNFVWQEIGGRRQWGSGVLTKNLPIKEFCFKNSYPGALVGAKVKPKSGLIFTVFSLYGLLEKLPHSNEGWATTTLHHMLSDLTPILFERAKKKDNIVIVGGDFNASIQCDEQRKNKSFYRNAHKIFFNRLEDFGLVNCFSKFYSMPVQTLRHAKSKLPWQNDYIFISKNIVKSLKSCEVINSENVWPLSDHNPVIVEIEI